MQVNTILRSFKRLKANAAEGGKPYKEETVEFKDTIDGLNVVVRFYSRQFGLSTACDGRMDKIVCRDIALDARTCSEETKERTWQFDFCFGNMLSANHRVHCHVLGSLTTLQREVKSGCFLGMRICIRGKMDCCFI